MKQHRLAEAVGEAKRDGRKVNAKKVDEPYAEPEVGAKRN